MIGYYEAKKSKVDEMTFAKLGKHLIAGMLFTAGRPEQTKWGEEKQANRIVEAVGIVKGG